MAKLIGCGDRILKIIGFIFGGIALVTALINFLTAVVNKTPEPTPLATLGPNTPKSTITTIPSKPTNIPSTPTPPRLPAPPTNTPPPIYFLPLPSNYTCPPRQNAKFLQYPNTLYGPDFVNGHSYWVSFDSSFIYIYIDTLVNKLSFPDPAIINGRNTWIPLDNTPYAICVNTNGNVFISYK